MAPRQNAVKPLKIAVKLVLLLSNSNMDLIEADFVSPNFGITVKLKE
jgi:hypothetical protein